MHTQSSNISDTVQIIWNKIADNFSEMDVAQKLSFNVRETSTSDFPNSKSLLKQKFEGACLDIGTRRTLIGY